MLEKIYVLCKKNTEQKSFYLLKIETLFVTIKNLKPQKTFKIFNFRYFAVTQPLNYSRRRRSKRLALVMILIVWVLALAITCPPILGW